jgi:hypothetical protein
MLLFTPHPPLRGTLSLQERDPLQTFFHFGQLRSMTAPTGGDVQNQVRPPYLLLAGKGLPV